MTVAEIMSQLQSKGSESIRKTLVKHGVKEPFFGVKISDLKPLQRKIKTDYLLAKDLYATGNADAMYLAGLIADDAKMTKADLQTWVKKATSNNISEYTVPWVAAGSRYGFDLALEWIESDVSHIAASGWSTLGNLVALKPDAELDLVQLKRLVDRVTKSINKSDDRVKYTMNAFLIAVGIYVTSLTDAAVAASTKIGTVTIDMNGTACKVPEVHEYIEKAKARGSLGKKKKMVKC